MKTTARILLFVTLFAICFSFSGCKKSEEALTREVVIEMQEAVDAYRNGKTKYLSFEEIPGFKKASIDDYVRESLESFFKNHELQLILDFMNAVVKKEEAIHDRSVYREYCWDCVQEILMNSEDTETCIEFFELASVYKEDFSKLNKDTPFIAAYIREREKPISTTPGTGYYADKKDASNTHQVGIEGSPLFDISKERYFGDFAYKGASGIGLDSTYNESYYREGHYYFRDYVIDNFYLGAYDFDNYEYIWAGDYLFIFSLDGDLEHYVRVEN